MKTNDAVLNCMSRVIEHYQEFLVSLRYKNKKSLDKTWIRNNKAGSYGYVPTRSIAELVEILTTVLSYTTKKLKRENISFLDAGCGVGNILLLAQVVGFHPIHGIELDANTVRLAKKLLGGVDTSRSNYFEPRVINTDLSKYDEYKRYDVIYYYQPLQPRSIPGKKFLSLMRENMNIGAIVIVNGEDPFKKDKRFKNIIRRNKLSIIDGVYEKTR